jgi:hypothetical protein
MPKKDGELSDEELEEVVGGSKDMKHLFGHWRGYIKEGADLKIGSFAHPHQNLNQSLWSEDDQLRPEVRERLLEIAQQFISKTQGADAEIKDITFTGSLANYNYSMLSDIDLHILIDFEQLNDDIDLVKDYFNAVKALWNYWHDIRIKDHEVEVYVQNETEPHVSSGIYSVMNDEWIKKPVPQKAEIDEESIATKANSLKDQIDRALALMEKDEYKEAYERAIKIRNKIKKFRKAGLETAGEYSVENLAFKALRNNGYLGKLSNLKREAYDKMMSLNEDILKPAIINLINQKRQGKTIKPGTFKLSPKMQRVWHLISAFEKQNIDWTKPPHLQMLNKIAPSPQPSVEDDVQKYYDHYKQKMDRTQTIPQPPSSQFQDVEFTESQLYHIVKEELIKEFTLTGIDVPRIVSLKRPVKKRSKAKDQVQRIETDLHATQDAVDRLEEYTREIYNMLVKVIRKNK